MGNLVIKSIPKMFLLAPKSQLNIAKIIKKLK